MVIITNVAVGERAVQILIFTYLHVFDIDLTRRQHPCKSDV